MQILAGPILRHANPDEINIWIVLDKKAAKIDGEILGENSGVLGNSQIDSRKPVQVGQQVFVYLLKLTPKSGRFPAEKILQYDLMIDGQRLADFGLTQGESRITYGSDALPGFVLKNKHQVILEGSCRKPHASKWNNKSQTDLMAAADDLVQTNKQNVTKRPSLLFLTGDQIYADDVATPLLAKIKKLVEEYIGHDQLIPKTNSSNVRVSTLELNARAKLLSGKGMGFTSSKKDNHLLSFGEFFMMYCVTWGGFDTKCPVFSEIRNEIALEGYENEINERENEYWTQRLVVEGFLEDARKVRRLLANVPTYMIFDDHDVTDDWNLDEGNYNAFRAHIFSRHVQNNALAAYWVCQGWGNTPDAYKAGFKTTIQQYLNNYPEDKFAKLESALLNRYWGYELDSYPYIVVLDTRNNREYVDGKLVKLMSTQTLAEVANRIQSVPGSKKINNSMLLISASPVYGFTEYERKILAAASNETFRRGLDVECWIANEMAFKQLQSTLLESGFDRCAIFSGDVHFGFCRYERLISSSGTISQLFQLTSSSLHNAPGKLKGLGLDILEKEAFMKHNTRYLLPENSKDEFINSSTNIGVLELKNGLPQIFYILDSEVCAHEKNTSTWIGLNKGKAWIYDLNNPRRLS